MSTKLFEEQLTITNDDINNDSDKNERQTDRQLTIAEVCFGFDTK